jgi:ABC-type enterochelin transport system permease subunit
VLIGVLSSLASIFGKILAIGLFVVSCVSALFVVTLLSCSFVGLIILPFISTWILSLVIWIVYLIYGLLPKNVHLAL